MPTMKKVQCAVCEKEYEIEGAYDVFVNSRC